MKSPLLILAAVLFLPAQGSADPAQEIEGLPPVTLITWYSGMGEGWARYSESLAAEMGLYRTVTGPIGPLAWPARKRFGEAFDIKAFHDRVLEHGAVPLTLLRAHVENWIESAAAAPPAAANAR